MDFLSCRLVLEKMLMTLSYYYFSFCFSIPFVAFIYLACLNWVESSERDHKSLSYCCKSELLENFNKLFVNIHTGKYCTAMERE